jgi:hypothetical protein
LACAQWPARVKQDRLHLSDGDYHLSDVPTQRSRSVGRAIQYAAEDAMFEILVMAGPLSD